MTEQSYTAVVRSGNHKVGPLPVVSRPQWSCPNDCPLMGAGCYGEVKPGRPSLFDVVDATVASSRSRTTMADLRNRRWRVVPRGIRFGIVGDFLDRAGHPDLDYINETNETALAHPWKAWGYTHAWRRLTAGMFAFVVRASVQSRAEAEQAIAAGWRVAIVDPGPDAPDTLIGSRISGQLVVQCPATNRPGVNCESCLLCARDIGTVVAFPVHGSLRGRAAAAVRKVRSTDTPRS